MHCAQDQISEKELTEIERQLCELWGRPTVEAADFATRQLGRLLAAYRRATDKSSALGAKTA